MDKLTRQMEEWAGDFGSDYTDRNALSPQEVELIYRKRYGITRTEMNAMFIGGFDRAARILEVGCNIGSQLVLLQEMGFVNLYGIDLQSYAVELSKSRTKGVNIIQGSIFDIPFKDNFFDLVFTSGLLIHIAPDDINRALDEIYRVSIKYIWGFEYYAEVYTQIPYRGHDNLLWKANYSRLFLDRFRGLTLVKEEHFKWLDTNENVDFMFLLQQL